MKPRYQPFCRLLPLACLLGAMSGNVAAMTEIAEQDLAEMTGILQPKQVLAAFGPPDMGLTWPRVTLLDVRRALFAAEVEDRPRITPVAAGKLGQRNPEGRLFPATRIAHARPRGGHGGSSGHGGPRKPRHLH